MFCVTVFDADIDNQIKHKTLQLRVMSQGNSADFYASVYECQTFTETGGNVL